MNPDGDGPATAPKLPTRVPFAGPHPGSLNPDRPRPGPPPAFTWRPRADVVPAGPPEPPKDQNQPRWVRAAAGAVAAAVLGGGFLWWSHRGAAAAAVPPTVVPPAATSSPAPAPAPPPPSTAVPRPPSTAVPRPAAPRARVNTAGRNLALGGAVTASSIERRDWSARNAVDGDPATRWSSGFSDPQWLRVDLGARWQLTEIRLSWENAHATAYRLEVSTDGRKWRPVYRTTDGRGGDVTVELARVPARYVRMYGTERSTAYGYSLLELEVR